MCLLIRAGQKGNECMANESPIRRRNIAVEALRKIGAAAAYLVLAIIVFAACWFEFKIEKEGYDLLVCSRFVKHTYYGVFYKEAFEVWEIKKNEDDSFQTTQLFPR